MTHRALGTVLLAWTALSCSGWCAERVQIDLLGRLEVSSNVALISDVARVAGGDLISRRKIAGLDIATLNDAHPTKRLTKRQIHLRILLAGFSPDDFRLNGPESLIVTLREPRSLEDRLLEVLTPVIANRLGRKPADMQLQLAKPLSANAEKYVSDEFVLEHSLHNNVSVGILNTAIRVRNRNKLVSVLPVSVDIQVYQDVFTAQRQIDAGTIIAEDDVLPERHLISGREKYVVDSPVGKQAKRTLEPGKLLVELDLQKAKAAKREVAIRSRDLVDIVVRGSALRAKISGAIALENGAPGDTIRFKNPRSNKKDRVLTATVVSTGLAEIRL